MHKKKPLNLFLILAMVVVLAVTLFGALLDFAFGMWPISLAMLIVGTAYFVMKLSDRVYLSNPPRIVRVFKSGYWLSFTAMVVLFAILLVPSVTYSLLSDVSEGTFFIWVTFYAAVVISALVRFVSNPSVRRRVLYWRTIVTILLVFIIVAPLILIEIRSEQDVNRLETAVNEVAQKELTPAGALPYTQNGGTNVFYRKDGILGRADCDYVHPCPTGGGDWLLITSKSRSVRHDFSVTALRSLGYTVGDGTSDAEVWGVKHGVVISLNSIDLSGERTPYSAPAGKVWQRVQVVANLLSGPTSSSTAQSNPPAMNQYTSKNGDLSFAYPHDWSLENDSTSTSGILLMKSPHGKFALQPFGEPMAATGEVIRMMVTPCTGGLVCSLNGVYEGVYKYASRGPQLQLDDGTLYDNFSFQYQGEQATDYSVFFRGGNKYVVTFNIAGKDINQLYLDQDVTKLFRPFINSIRFDN